MVHMLFSHLLLLVSPSLLSPSLPIVICSDLRTDLLHIGVDPTEVSAKAGLSESLEALAELATLPIVSFHYSSVHVTKPR